MGEHDVPSAAARIEARNLAHCILDAIRDGESREPLTVRDAWLLASSLVWATDMLERARRVCTMARRYVVALEERSPATEIRLRDLRSAVEALVAEGEAEAKR